MRFADLASDSIDSLDRETPVVFPVARTVPRGPGFPVGIESKVLEITLSQLDGERWLFLPTPPFALAAEFQGLAGRLSTSPTTFSAVVADVLEAVLSQGFRRVLILSVDLDLRVQMLSVVRQVRSQNSNSVLWAADLQSLAGGDAEFLGHIGKGLGLLTEYQPSQIDPPLRPTRPEFVALSREISPSGSVLYPGHLDADSGRELHTRAVIGLTALLEEMTRPTTFQ
jgi:creatinine amidohydrolase/Fe(II)-dependent formamide hydrolase-like protein